MKKGDKLPVTIQGIVVAQAEVEYVETDRVTLVIPGTRAVVGVRVSLTDEAPTVEPAKETIIDGVVTPDNVSATVETVEAQPEVVEAKPDTNTETEAKPVETNNVAPATSETTNED